MGTRFRDLMCDDQKQWRARALQNSTAWGIWQGKTYPHILPWGDRWLNFWEELRPGRRFDLDAYLGTGIQAHDGRANLLSSWALCANLYFPFGQDPDGLELLQTFLREYVHPDIASIRAVELEYAEPEKTPLHPAELLGERDGTRGSHQTSPDVAFAVRMADGRDGLVLTEVKFTEHHFYACSARKLMNSGQRGVCKDPSAVATKPDLCPQHHQLHRRYWHHLGAPLLNSTLGRSLGLCPAATDGYQLFRQQALAEGIAASGKYGFVASTVAYDERNRELMSCLDRSGVPRVDRDWKDVFAGTALFRVVTHQAWVAWVRRAPQAPAWTRDWAAYVTDRYGL